MPSTIDKDPTTPSFMPATTDKDATTPYLPTTTGRRLQFPCMPIACPNTTLPS